MTIFDGTSGALAVGAGTVGATQIIDGSITGTKLASATVTGSNIASATITADKLSGGSSGSAPVYGCRAWCVFNGTTTGTNAPTAGGNVTSVTRNATGDYTINFTTAMPSSSYVVSITGAQSGARANTVGFVASTATAPTTTSVRIRMQDDTSTLVDEAFTQIAVFA